jgi:hypothetical protein
LADFQWAVANWQWKSCETLCLVLEQMEVSPRFLHIPRNLLAQIEVASRLLHIFSALEKKPARAEAGRRKAKSD